MKTEEALQILQTFNAWRRGAEIPRPDPVEIGKAIDTAIEKLKQIQDEKPTKSTP